MTTARQEALDPAPARAPLGVNVAGYVRAELGVGEAARLMVSALKSGGIPYSVVPFDRTSNRQESEFDDYGTEGVDHPVNLICVNADQLPHFARTVGAGFFRNRYSIGFWFWEVEDFPETMHLGAELVDEIWVASRHAERAIGRAVETPVFCCPLPVVPVEPPSLTRAELGLPEGFLFLFTFDFNSVLERKNPLGLIDAFRRAFEPGEGPTLVLKTINGDLHPDRREVLRRAAAGRPDIVLIERYFSTTEQRALVNVCDATVSLHRSEGFGLTMAEAMLFGKPVIATAYSGNLEFMDEDNSYLVPYELTEVPAGCDPYPAGSRWADPDLDVAAQLMRRVHERPDEAAERGRRAARDIRTLHSPERRASLVGARLEQIDRERRPFGRAASRVGTLLAAPAVPARAHLEAAPVVSARIGVRAVQRAVLRAIRSYTEHQRATTTALVAELEALQGELRQLAADHRRVSRRLGELEERSGPSSERGGSDE
jgi:glycosyltransferase involved in cell wall biosynthesis